MMPTIETARGAVLDAVAAVMTSLCDSRAASVLASIPHTAMRPGGARVIGTSYELEPAMAAAVMMRLIGKDDEGDGGDDEAAPLSALLHALTQGDADARIAVLKGAQPPAVLSLYPHAAGFTPLRSDALPGEACHRLANSIQRMWSAPQVQQRLEQINQWASNPATLDHMPLQRFIAQFVRNTPP
jgi:hypothetical protein